MTVRRAPRIAAATTVPPAPRAAAAVAAAATARGRASADAQPRGQAPVSSRLLVHGAAQMPSSFRSKYLDYAELTGQLRAWEKAHPGFVKRMKQNPDKSDFTDARLLADRERVGYLLQVWIAPRQLRDFRTLVRERQTLARRRRTCKQQIGALLRENRQRCSHGRRTKRWLRWLTDEAQLMGQPSPASRSTRLG